MLHDENIIFETKSNECYFRNETEWNLFVKWEQMEIIFVIEASKDYFWNEDKWKYFWNETNDVFEIKIKILIDVMLNYINRNQFVALG